MLENARKLKCFTVSFIKTSICFYQMPEPHIKFVINMIKEQNRSVEIK